MYIVVHATSLGFYSSPVHIIATHRSTKTDAVSLVYIQRETIDHCLLRCQNTEDLT